jgi:hypothetical protein
MAESDARPRPPAGWDAHPEVKAVCKPVLADDGLFWLEKSEFFKYANTIYPTSSHHHLITTSPPHHHHHRHHLVTISSSPPPHHLTAPSYHRRHPKGTSRPSTSARWT